MKHNFFKTCLLLLAFFSNGYASNQMSHVGYSTTFCNDTSNQLVEKPLYISLGVECTTSLMLKQLNLREKSYPFDWVISPHDALINALNDDFMHYFTSLTIRADNDGVIDYYGFEFPHVNLPDISTPYFDFEIEYKNGNFIFESWNQYIPAAKETSLRRLDRFRNACLGNRKVYFVRSSAHSGQGPITQEQAIILRNTIKRKYPNLDFCLIIISNLEDFKIPWNIDGIKNYYGFPPSDLEWKPRWEEILKDASY